MTFSALDSFLSTPGDIYVIPGVIGADHNFLVTNTDLAADDVRLWGTLLLGIYIPNPVDEVATCFSHNCYTRNEVIFNPLPGLGSLNLQVAFYSGVNTKPRNIIIWTE